MVLLVKKFSFSFKHFQAPGDGTSQVGKTRYYDIRDNFKLSKQQTHSHPRANMTHGNVGVTCVAWSKPLHKSTADGASERGDDRKREDEKIDSIVAAAGSNGVVAVWSARQAFFSEGSGESSTLANQQPEAILSQHTRAVNKLAWHPNKPGLLLTASQVSFSYQTHCRRPNNRSTDRNSHSWFPIQDATAKLWERRAVTPKVDNESNAKLHFRFFNKIQSDNSRSYSWFCRGTFEPKSEAVRDIQWSKFQDDSKYFFPNVSILKLLSVIDHSLMPCHLSAFSFCTGDCEWISRGIQHAHYCESNCQDCCS